ncbi:TonB family protein [Candidatus Dependentiae bacterium]|nr:TonB family protein [Candidatus Dependentiae bacterium]
MKTKNLFTGLFIILFIMLGLQASGVNISYDYNIIIEGDFDLRLKTLDDYTYNMQSANVFSFFSLSFEIKKFYLRFGLPLFLIEESMFISEEVDGLNSGIKLKRQFPHLYVGIYYRLFQFKKLKIFIGLDILGGKTKLELFSSSNLTDTSSYKTDGNLTSFSPSLIINIGNYSLQVSQPYYLMRSFYVGRDNISSDLKPKSKILTFSLFFKMTEDIIPLDSNDEKSVELLGKPAPDFELTDINGKVWKLSDLKGKVVVMDFWATWCAPCVKEMKELIPILEKYKNRDDFIFLTINSENLKKEDYDKFIKKLGVNDFPTLLDTGNKVNSAYGINAIPALVVIDKEGKVASHIVGYSPFGLNNLEKEIDKLLKESKPKPEPLPLPKPEPTPKPKPKLEPEPEPEPEPQPLPKPEPIPEPKGETRGPKLTSKITPEYPPKARQMGLEGKVVIEVTVDINGNVINYKIIESAGNILDNAVIKAVQKAKFNPALKDGKPVEGKYVFSPYTFRI